MDKDGICSAIKTSTPETDVKGQRLTNDQAKRLLKRLIKTANMMIQRSASLTDAAQSAEDFAMEAITDLLAGDLDWDPTKLSDDVSVEDKLAKYLSGVIRNRLKDCYRQSRKRKPPASQEDARRTSDLDRLADSQPASRSSDPEHGYMVKDDQRRLISLMRGDPVAIALIKVAPEISGGGRLDQELAETIFGDHTKTSKIVNARKRIKRAVMNERSQWRTNQWKAIPLTRSSARPKGAVAG